jgi:hypothetical protein
VSRATALASRHVAYAMKFVNETEAEPTDEAIERALSGCVRAPKPEEYPRIREEVECWRKWGLTSAELAELDDDTPVWGITRGHLNRIAGRCVTDDECTAAVQAIKASDALDTASDAVARAIDGRYV